MRDRAVSQLQALLDAARQDVAVLAVILFGSSARGEQTRGSDVDVCLVLTVGARPVEEPELSRKRLEYLGQFDLDVHVFQQLPLYMRRRILREGRVLFTRNEDALYRVAFRTAQAFEDFRPFYETYLRQVASD